MTIVLDLLVMLLVLTGLRLVASSRLSACIQTVVLQAVVLAAVAMALHADNITLELLGLVATTLVVKAMLLPWLLRRAAREAGVAREIEPLVGFTTSVLIGGVLLGLCFVISRPLQASAPPGTTLLIPGAMFTILSGLFIIVSRRKALTQVLGYLAMENGVYAFGVALAVGEPLLVEMGVLLDVLVAVFVMGIAIHHINREFDHIDTDRLSVLKD